MLQAHVTNLDASPFLGRLALLRIFNGTLKKGQTVAWARQGRPVEERSDLRAAGRKEETDAGSAESAGPSEIVAVAGIEDITIGETLTDPENPQPLR